MVSRARPVGDVGEEPGDGGADHGVLVGQRLAGDDPDDAGRRHVLHHPGQAQRQHTGNIIATTYGIRQLKAIKRHVSLNGCHPPVEAEVAVLPQEPVGLPGLQDEGEGDLLEVGLHAPLEVDEELGHDVDRRPAHLAPQVLHLKHQGQRASFEVIFTSHIFTE